MISAQLMYINGKNLYSNDYASFNTIDYITRFNDKNIFYYGNWPPTKETAIKLFQDLRIYNSSNTIQQQVWHFWVTFQDTNNINFVNTFANNIALIFVPFFPICLATHIDGKHLHTHFVVSTTSHVPNHPPLTKQLWNQYLEQIKNISLQNYGIDLYIISKKDSKKEPYIRPSCLRYLDFLFEDSNTTSQTIQEEQKIIYK